ncbi:aminopeptidase P family protein [Cohaesibacter gelatinilyticus]|uniref:Xaa-Pro aminopeptidase n=1 Tax=Cohaesibacter gelatinilyticus TaxID=372072 RepID=A0A285NHR7_9HYPH|nr:aminopeptidase P family protein [Cohaesibacter gelatinilyticus]SNZ09034.1 Xaa-Pro aminopeptidase [Cohaesibacter gelatinilyticus]
MFQIFSDQASPDQGRVRLPLLREELQEQGLTGFILPRADEYGGENLADYAERLAWLTGFTGSAGTVIVLRNKAAIFIDGRYTLQVRDQVDTDLLTPVSFPETTPAQWLKENIKEGDVIGFDPWLHTAKHAEQLEQNCIKAKAKLEPVSKNPVDSIWSDQPARPSAPIVPQPFELTGRNAEDKIQLIADKIADKADATFITQADSVAWLLNIRGADVPRAPLPLAFAIVTKSAKAYLICEEKKLPRETCKLLPNNLTVVAPKELEQFFTGNEADAKSWLIDLTLTPQAVVSMLELSNAVLVEGSDPCLRLKSAKTPEELAGMRSAHLRDGAAMVRFLSWLDNVAPTGTVDEIQAAKQLEQCRTETGCLKDISFDTISGAGPNGAIVHYRVTETTNRRLEENSLYLVDSGGQYPDGTTDITRTIAIGEPDAEMRACFTRVLKGMIAISLARFPQGTTGAQLDTLARHALWQVGLDYAHGTGHGVGSYLCVHEGPQNISKRGSVPLEEGNILSNEPGYYKEGTWGIRIENLVAVQKAEVPKGGELAVHEFETLTLCPIDRRLVDTNLLGIEELNWLNDYHERVFAELSNDLEEDERLWLAEATKPLHKS